MTPDAKEFENSPGQVGLLHTEVIYTSGQISESLEMLLENREISPFQYMQLEKAVRYSEKIYTLNPRRDGFRNHAVGHVFPNVENIIRNRGEVVAIVKDEVAQLRFNPQDMGASQEQRSLYASILLMLGHDWYEDYMGAAPREVFKEQVKRDFGEDIHNIIEILTKPDKGAYSDIERDQVYYQNLTTCNSPLVAIIKLLDRNSNHNDDFGVYDFDKVKDYCTDTEQNLLPWFEEMLTGPRKIFVDELTQTVEKLREDADESEALFRVSSIIAEAFLKEKRSDGTTWVEHSERMIKRLKSLGLRKTLGFTDAITLHDLIDLDGEQVTVAPAIRDALSDLLRVSPEKAAYSIGIALGAKKLEAIMTGYLRNVHLSYSTQDENVRDRLNNLYSPRQKMPMSFDELGEMVDYEPVIATEVMQEMSEWDIESLLVLVLERLDNLEHPVQYQQPIEGKRILMDDALYQWKTAQELLFLHPLLEIGGFRDLASVVRGKAFEFLLQGKKISEQAEAEYKENKRFMKEYKERILLDVLAVDHGQRVIFRHREKELGSTEKKMFDSARKKEPTEVGDHLSMRFIYDDPSFPYTLDSIINIANQTTNQIRAGLKRHLERFSGAGKEVRVEIENPRPDRKHRGIYLKTANQNCLSAAEVRSQSLQRQIGNVNLDKVEIETVGPDDFEYSQFYVKITGVPGFAKPIYIEVQLVSKESYERGTVGPAAHHVYKINQGLDDIKKGGSEEEQKQTFNISKFDQFVLLKLFKRFAAYRSSYRAHLFLSQNGRDLLNGIFGDQWEVYKEWLPQLDFDEFSHQNGLEEAYTHILVNYILPYIA